MLRDSTNQDDPRVIQAERRVEVIEERIDAERRKLGLGTADAGENVFATLVGEYEGLVVEREFAERAYTSALAAYDSAQAEARRQNRYLAAHVRPTLAEKAEYPERFKILALLGVFLFLAWAIASLIFYSIRDRS
jgi:capsular polysaccharide transport system permease protein